MKEKLDKLGRRIPQFDRNAAARKGRDTRKENYGNDVYSKLNASGDHSRNRGYFGMLKDQGKEDELRAISRKGAIAKSESKSKNGKTTHGNG